LPLYQRLVGFKVFQFQRWLFGICCLSLMWLGVGGYHDNNLVMADTPPLPLDRYWSKLEQTQVEIATLSNTPIATQQTTLTQLAEDWATINQVLLPDGTVITVDHSFLLAELQTDEPDIPRLEVLLNQILTLRNQESNQFHFDAQALSSILAQAEFQWQTEQESFWETWWQDLQERFYRFLLNLLPEALASAVIGGWLNFLLTLFGSIALVIVLAYTIHELLRGVAHEVAVGEDDEVSGELLTSETALKRAQDLSQGGDYRTAVRYLYLSSLLILEEQGLLRYDRTKTNREYIRSIQSQPKLATILQDVINIFDQVWYGYHPIDQKTYTHYATLVAQLRQQK